jgi:proteasome lid subunit RPN8/RPN11
VIQIPATIYDAMVEHARAARPAECCGLLAGRGAVVSKRFELRNELASPVAYQADPRDLFAAFRGLREHGLELLAIYHSHPTSPARPSRTDLEQNFYGDVPRIIISLVGDPPVVKAFRLFEDRFDELPVHRRGN